MFGDNPSPATENWRNWIEDNDGDTYSRRDKTLPQHEVFGDVIIYDQCAHPSGDMLYPSNLNNSKIIPHRVQPKEPPVKPYGTSYSHDLLHSTWPWFGKK